VRKLGGVRWPAGVTLSIIVALLLGGHGAAPVHAQDRYEIAGEVDGLYPGAETTLDARVTNPYPFAIRVIATGARVLDAAPGCPASMLVIGESLATAVLPAGGSDVVPLPVRMRRDAPDACQGATWPLAFTGTAVGTATGPLPGTSMFGPGGLGVPALIGVALLTGGLMLAGRRRRRERAGP